MSKDSALKIIDKCIGIDDTPSHEYTALTDAMYNWFSSNDLEEFAKFLQDEHS